MVMARVARTTLPDGYFHVSGRGVDRRMPLFRDDADRRLFVSLLARAARRHRWTTHAHCLLSTHYHLVVEAKRHDLSSGLCWLHGTYARRFNRRHGHFGHVFAERFAARVIDTEEYLHDACSYVLLNPIRAGLCDRIEQWPWSYSRVGLAAA
jgi:REP element-mobilizing transposase RayT